mmetsp:Transcript_6905/g.13665  ORF Transcript_6905/g.13665 Transcript_6905/m.13665 type:complete len:83 (+) Transcript_6905:622-870(+)
MRRKTTCRLPVNGRNDCVRLRSNTLYLTNSIDGEFAQRTLVEQDCEEIFDGAEIEGGIYRKCHQRNRHRSGIHLQLRGRCKY